MHRELGCGFLEPVYQQALGLEFEARRIPFSRELALPIMYKGRQIDATYRIDFLCFDEVVIEVKALARLSNIEQAQLLNYLKAGRYAIGLLINFGAPSLEWKRMAGRVAN